MHEEKAVNIQYLDAPVLLEPKTVAECRVFGYPPEMNRWRWFNFENISEIEIVNGASE